MSKYKKNIVISAYILIFPFVLIYCLFLLYPTLYTLLFSFTNSPLIGWGDWVGLENYIKLWNDKFFWKSLKNTFVFVFWTVIPNTIIGLMCAMMISRIKNFLLSGALLACFFLPHILPVTVVTEIWQWMVSKQFGIIQEGLDYLGFKRIGFFSQRAWAMPMVALITIWWTVGFNILLFIVGMFLDAGPAIIILGPILGPVFVELGVHPVHFAIIMSVNLTVGLATPPMGLVLFVASSVSGERVETIAKAILPFLAVEAIVIFLITYFPAISMTIPLITGFAK